MTLANLKRYGLLGVAAAISALVATGAATAQESVPVTDQQIADAVENEFLFDQAVQSADLTTVVNDGVVTLTGTVDNLLEKERAVRIAETVRGVESVDNRLAVEPGIGKTDAEVRSDIEQAMLADPAADAYEVTVGVSEGYVTLSGATDSWQEKQLAAKLAKSVTGVIGVDNDITVTGPAERADAEVREDVEAALRWDALVDAALIDVAVDEGLVTLDGTVASASEKARARAQAWVAGVSDVNAENLAVEAWAEDPMVATDDEAMMTDTQVASAIESNLALDPRVFSFDVTTTVDNGVAILRGEVDNLKAKRAAARVARNTAGVRRVKNRVVVSAPEGEMLEEQDLEENIEMAMLRNP